MTTDELRDLFLTFFEERGHTLVPSDSLVPRDDPTVLFTPAGMNQFKDAFVGTVSPGYTRAATSQKCLRTTDIDEVGRTAYHHSFFEMLGNFSFGDYFKREAIEYAWEFMRSVLRIPADRMRVSVYASDEEAYAIWADVIEVPHAWIYRFDEHENFWPADAPSQSPAGTLCGPDTEIFVDMGPATGCGRPDCTPACDCGRFVEVWNLVFQQFEKGDAPGDLRRLPTNNVDTGLGLERLAAVMQGKMSDYEIDIFAPLVAKAADLLGLPASGPRREDPDVQRRLNRISDHVRAVVFCLADGVRPSNEGRGYVERRLLRRAALDGMRLGAETPFLHEMVPAIVRVMRGGYPDLADSAESFADTIRREEDLFIQVVDQRSPMIRSACRRLAASGQQSAVSRQRNPESAIQNPKSRIQNARRSLLLPGDLAADWAQTHGIPVELTEAIAAEFGLALDRDGYDEAMEVHRERSRAGSTFAESVFSDATRKVRAVQDRAGGARLVTEFVGHKRLRSTGTVIAILDANGSPTNQASPEDGQVEIILDRTPFYAEAGGQTADRGTLTKRGFEFEVVAAKRGADLVWHTGTVKTGRVKVGQRLTAQVDAARRAGLARSHTATHLLQFALRAVLGEHVAQAGSRVEDGSFTFDFSHPGALSADEQRRVEDLVNERILADDAVRAGVMALDEAKEAGAIMLFGEKYGERVRLVSVGDYSRELCGGTHVRRTGEIGLLKVVGEESVAAGVRRITAVTGFGVMSRLREQEALLGELGGLLRAPTDALPARARSLLEETKRLRRDLQRAVQRGAVDSADEILANARDVGDAKVVARAVGEAGMEQLRHLADSLKRKCDRLAAVLAGVVEGRVQIVALVTPPLVARGLRADAIIREVAAVVKGGGGGRPDLAQAGGKDPSGIDEAIALAQRLMEDALGP